MVGLALCGGGIKCAAHLGVLRVFQHHGIDFDIIAGSSAGALAGALYASGRSLDEIDRDLRQMHPRDVVRFTVGRHGLGDYRRFRRFLQTVIGQKRIEHLPRRLVITAVDLACGRTCLLEEGDLADAVYASCALPGVFQPLCRDGQVLMDGSLLEPLPVAALRQRGARVCVGVYFQRSPAAREPASAVEVIHRSFQVMMHEMARPSLDQADVLVQPDVGSCSIFDFSRLQDCLDAGIAAARQVLPLLQQRLAAAGAAAEPDTGVLPAAMTAPVTAGEPRFQEDPAPTA